MLWIKREDHMHAFCCTKVSFSSRIKLQTHEITTQVMPILCVSIRPTHHQQHCRNVTHRFSIWAAGCCLLPLLPFHQGKASHVLNLAFTLSICTVTAWDWLQWKLKLVTLICTCCCWCWGGAFIWSRNLTGHGQCSLYLQSMRWFYLSVSPPSFIWSPNQTLPFPS